MPRTSTPSSTGRKPGPQAAARSELPGGLTNRNYKVTTPDGAFVARISSGGSELLTIDRDCEYRNSVTAAAAGAGRRSSSTAPRTGCWSSATSRAGRSRAADVAAAANIPRIARACRLLHAGARFGNDFDMFDIQRRYLAVARSRGFRIPAGYDDLVPQVSAAEKALAVRAEGTVPCHNDLLPANFIDDGERIWLIDYELSGNNDACFELGNIGAECAPVGRRPGRAGHGLLRPAAAEQDRPGPAARRPGRHVRLDAVGRDPARREPDRLRLLVLGHGTVRGRGRRFHRRRFRPASSRTSSEMTEHPPGPAPAAPAS